MGGGAGGGGSTALWLEPGADQLPMTPEDLTGKDVTFQAEKCPNQRDVGHFGGLTQSLGSIDLGWEKTSQFKGPGSSGDGE